MKPRLLPVAAGILLSLLFAALAFRGVDPGRALAVARRLETVPFVEALIFFLAMMGIRAERFRLLLGAAAPGAAEGLRIAWVGAGALYVFPARLGEAVRPALLARRGRSASAAFGAVVVERLLDGAAQIALFLLLLPHLAVPDWVGRGALLLALLYLTLAAALLLAARFAAAADRLIGRALAPWPALAARARGAATRFAGGISPCARPLTLLSAVALTAVAWWFSVEFLNRLLAACGFAFIPSNLLAASFLQFMLTVGIVIPAAPGYLGTFHYFTLQALLFFGAARDDAAGFALLLHALSVSLVVGPALPFVLTEGWGAGRSPAEKLDPDFN